MWPGKPKRFSKLNERGGRTREDDIRDEEKAKGWTDTSVAPAACGLSTDLFSSLSLRNNRPLLSIGGFHKRVMCASRLNALLISLARFFMDNFLEKFLQLRIGSTRKDVTMTSQVLEYTRTIRLNELTFQS